MKKGFTILELIIVIIIVGVLASLALPKFIKFIEFSRSSEAIVSIHAIRDAIERCYIMNNKSYTGCGAGYLYSWGNLAIEDPGKSPNAHFCYYAFGTDNTGGQKYYVIHAFRNKRENKDYYKRCERISFWYGLDTGQYVARCGTGPYKNLNSPSDFDGCEHYPTGSDTCDMMCGY